MKDAKYLTQITNAEKQALGLCVSYWEQKCRIITHECIKIFLTPMILR
jgi:hypothetical protein